MHDAEAIDDAFNENAVYEDVAAGTVRHGVDDIKTGLRVTFNAVPDFKVKLTTWFSAGNMLFCEWVMSGTQTGDYPEIPATGKSFSVKGASIASIKDGKFEQWTDYYDLYSFLYQLGVIGKQDIIKDSSVMSDHLVTGTKAYGSLVPDGSPIEKPERINTGKNCIVNLVQPYKITGTLNGTITFNYRILIKGPCGSPPGTYSEEWIAYGSFKGEINKNVVSAEMSYTAKVKAGGEIEGKILSGNGLEGELRIYGNFSNGKLLYTGIIK